MNFLFNKTNFTKSMMLPKNNMLETILNNISLKNIDKNDISQNSLKASIILLLTEQIAYQIEKQHLIKL